MKIARHFAKFTALALVSLLVACASQQEPAKQALDGIQSAIDGVSAEAEKYVPEQLAAVKQKYADLKSSFDKKDYAAVVTGAPAVLASAKDLESAAAAKKDEVMKALGSEWTSLTAAVPGLISAVQSRVAVLSKSKRPPKDVDLTAAQSGLAAATDSWTQAQTASGNGNVEEAVNLAKAAKDKIVAAAQALKLTLPGA